MNKTLFALLLVAAGFVLTGCGNSDSADTSANKIPGAPAGAQSGVSQSTVPGAPATANAPR